MRTWGEGIKYFHTLGDLEQPKSKSFWFEVKCPYCRDGLMQLCPPKRNLESTLRNHMASTKHMQAVEESKNTDRRGSALLSGRRERPWTTSSIVHSNQPDLHTFYKGPAHEGQEGDSSGFDSHALLSLMCWDFRGPNVMYGDVSYVVLPLLDDRHVGALWYPEPHATASFLVDEVEVLVRGTFCHRDCHRLSGSIGGFLNFICSMYEQIPRQDDFRKRVVREAKCD